MKTRKLTVAVMVVVLLLGAVCLAGAVAPPQIKDLAAKAQSYNKVTLTWTSTGGSRVEVKYRESQALTTSNWTATTGTIITVTVPNPPVPGSAGTKISFDVFIPKANTKDYFGVRSYSATGEASVVSNSPYAITMQAGKIQIGLAWDPPDDYYTYGYVLAIGLSSGNYRSFQNVADATSAYVIINNGTRYYFAAYDYVMDPVTFEIITESDYSNEVVYGSPTMASIFISPNPAYKATTSLTALPTTSGGFGTISYRYQWKKNGVDIAGATAATLSNGNYVKGNVISVSVTPGDSLVYGNPMTSAGVSILNSLPTQPTVTITPSPPRDASNLTCTPTKSTDADGDPIIYTYAWYKNGVLQTSLTTNTVSATLTSVGQAWRCVVAPRDSSGSGPSGQATVTIVK